MQLTPEDLSAHQYQLLDQLGHKELIPFIQTYIRKKTIFSRLYQLANVLAFAAAGFFFAIRVNDPGYSIGDRFTQFGYGLALAFALLPLHEYIHVLAYRSQGAVHTSYAANLKKFYFMALADRFVASRKEFLVVALAPFVTITITGIVLLFLVSMPWKLTITGTLLAHTAMCAGDFGLLSYFAFHKDKEVVTYDDVENKISFFYGKPAGHA